MKLWTLTFEKVQQLRDQHQKKVEELQEMKRKTAKDLWLHDLERFEEAYTAYVKKRNLANFGKESLHYQTSAGKRLIAGEKRALESTQKPEVIQNDLKHEGANLVLPSPKRKSPERTTEKKSPKQKKVAKKIMSSDSGSLTPAMPKRKAENSKEKETSKKHSKPKEENLVKRKPQKKAERYESDDEDSVEAARKPKRQKATHASKPTTKKLNLDDSDLELMQKNQRILAKEDKKKRKPKAKAIASDESSVLSEESDASEPSDASDSEY